MSLRACLPAALGPALLVACAGAPRPADPGSPPAPPEPPPVSASAPAVYRCDDGSSFRVQEQADVLVLDGLDGGPHRLERDAGGLTPEQSVWSGPHLRVEFGVGPQGRQAVVQVLQSQRLVACSRS